LQAKQELPFPIYFQQPEGMVVGEALRKMLLQLVDLEEMVQLVVTFM
jgi:hypothetical protein